MKHAPLPPLSMHRLIKTELRIVEPMQMEASFQYRLMFKDQAKDLVYPDRYEVDCYFIFPPQMRISQATYPIESFYRDLKSFINFRIPKLSYKEIVGGAENLERSPLRKIIDELESSSPIAEKQRFLQQEARIFACSFYTFTQRKVKRLQKQIDKTRRFGIGEVEELEAAQQRIGIIFEESFNKIHHIFREWQKILKLPEAQHPAIEEILKPIDEYISHNIHDFILNVDRSLYDIRLPESGGVPWRHLLKKGLRGLRIYSLQQGYQWIDDASSELDLERYYYHRGSLKRQVWSALYLDTRTKPLFKFQRQVGAMVAAGVAGVWAILADITIRANSGMYGFSSVPSLGFSTFLIISAFTLAYILKDRIKEYGKGYFEGGAMGRLLPDSSSKIIYQANSRRKSLHIGNHEEKVSFPGPKGLPEDLRRLLEDLGHERWEQETHGVICYKKRIDLRSKKIQRLRHKIRAIYTFFRLNVANFLAPLDSPYEELLIPTRGLETSSRLFPKVYHIDLIMKISARVGKEKQVGSFFQYWRLVINKNGIKRIDEVKLPETAAVGAEAEVEEEPLSHMESFDEVSWAHG